MLKKIDIPCVRSNFVFRNAHPALRNIILGYYWIKNPELLKNRKFIVTCECSLFIHFFLDDIRFEVKIGEKSYNSKYSGMTGGQISGPAVAFSEDRLKSISVAIFPVAFSQMVGVSAHELKNHFVSITDVQYRQFEPLIDILRRQNCIEIQKATLDSFFLQRLPINEELLFFYRCLGPLYNSSGTVKVDEIRKGVYLSKRQFERRFKECFGATASTLRRQIRSSAALKGLLENKDIFAVIEELDYTDQSHLTKDLKWYTGHSPGSLLENFQNKVLQFGPLQFLVN
ncbi:MAG: AraC family transcriptional regulator [Deltaproteobacteria bacterium]|nr:AraC family transcriptional regulator [Deltaproteobacteria bacterium]